MSLTLKGSAEVLTGDAAATAEQARVQEAANPKEAEYALTGYLFLEDGRSFEISLVPKIPEGQKGLKASEVAEFVSRLRTNFYSEDYRNMELKLKDGTWLIFPGELLRKSYMTIESTEIK